MAQGFAEIAPVFSGLELRTTKARAASSMAERRKRGDYIGRAGYGFRLTRNEAGAIVTEPDPDRPLEPVLEAVRETGGNILAACKLLNARGVPVPQGPSAERRRLDETPNWHPWPLRKIVARNAPELLSAKGQSGRRTPTHRLLAQLLVCHCGHVLTPEGRGRWGTPAYRCTHGNRTGRLAHGPMFVTEAALLPWIRSEMEHFGVPRLCGGQVMSLGVLKIHEDAPIEQVWELGTVNGALMAPWNVGLAEVKDLQGPMGQVGATAIMHGPQATRSAPRVTVADDRTKQTHERRQDDKPALCKAGWGLKDAYSRDVLRGPAEPRKTP
jgi:hypothetical protein